MTKSYDWFISGVMAEPHRRQLHVTMAHQYLPEYHAALEELARSKVDPQTPAKWELQLFSRDSRLASSEVSETVVYTAWFIGLH